MRQVLRPEAVAVVGDLRARGSAVELLSGDGSQAVEETARALGVARWRGRLKSAEKVARLEVLAAGGAKVLMVGDRINDAPPLAAFGHLTPPIAAPAMSGSSPLVTLNALSVRRVRA